MNQQKRPMYLQTSSLYQQRRATEPFNTGLFLHKCVAACCSVLQRVAACCSVLQRVAACCSVLQRVAARCSALQRVAWQCWRVPQWVFAQPYVSAKESYTSAKESYTCAKESYSYPIKPRVYHTRTFACVCVCVCVTLCMRIMTHKNKCTSIHVAHVPQPQISFCPDFFPFQKIARAVHDSPRH